MTCTFFFHPLFGVGTWENILKAVIKVRSWKWSHRASAPSCTSLDGDIRRPPEIPYWWRRPHRWWSKSLETPTPCPVSSHDTWPCAPLPQRCPRNRMRTPQSNEVNISCSTHKSQRCGGCPTTGGPKTIGFFAFEMTNSWGQEIFMGVDHIAALCHWGVPIYHPSEW